MALAKHKAFRQADMHNNFFRDCLRLEVYRLKNILGWQMSQGTRLEYSLPGTWWGRGMLVVGYS